MVSSGTLGAVTDAHFRCLHLSWVFGRYSRSDEIPGLRLCQNAHSALLFSTWAPGRSSIMDCGRGCRLPGFLSAVSIELR